MRELVVESKVGCVEGIAPVGRVLAAGSSLEDQAEMDRTGHDRTPAGHDSSPSDSPRTMTAPIPPYECTAAVLWPTAVVLITASGLTTA